MSAASVMRALWPAMARILRAIGRWVIRRVRRKGAQRIAYYMEERIDVFRARLKRARSKRRKHWLQGRIRRWGHAMRWLHRHAVKLNAAAARVLEDAAERARIPLNAAAERG